MWVGGKEGQACLSAVARGQAAEGQRQKMWLRLDWWPVPDQGSQSLCVLRVYLGPAGLLAVEPQCSDQSLPLPNCPGGAGGASRWHGLRCPPPSTMHGRGRFPGAGLQPIAQLLDPPYRTNCKITLRLNMSFNIIPGNGLTFFNWQQLATAEAKRSFRTAIFHRETLTSIAGQVRTQHKWVFFLLKERSFWLEACS